jgi:hypothetical protein
VFSVKAEKGQPNLNHSDQNRGGNQNPLLYEMKTLHTSAKAPARILGGFNQ